MKSRIAGLLLIVAACSLCSADEPASLAPIYELTNPTYRADPMADLAPIYEACPDMPAAKECDCDCGTGGECDCGTDCTCEGHDKYLERKQARRTQWLMFTADWCVECAKSKSDFSDWLKASGWKIDETSKAHIRLVNFDKSPELAREYKITKLPTFVLIHDGKTVERVETYPGRDRLAKRFADVASGKPASLATADAAPTPLAEVSRVIDLLPKPEIGFVDFGCGADARWCIAAVEKWGCKATGVEIDPARAEAARERARMLGLENSITIIEGDALTTDVRGDVAAVYLYPDLLSQLKSKLEGFNAVASYQHQVPGLPMVKNGNTWIYRKSQPAQVSQQNTRRAVWGGMAYSGRVCNSPGCEMCNNIQAQISGF